MRFFAIAATLFAAASAHYSVSSEACSTVTVTLTVPAVPVGTGYPVSSVPAGTGYPVVPVASSPPYPTGAAPYPSVPAPSGTGYPVVPAPSGTASPSGTGVYTPPVPEFTGAASSMNVPAVAAGIMGLAAYFL